MSEIRFTRDHEWVSLDGDIATVGITNHAQSALGDVVFIELPEAGRQVAPAQPCAVVESVKAASDVYAPLAGTVTEANAALVAEPAMVNREAEAGAWFFRMRLLNRAGFDALMSPADYQAFVQSL